MGSNISSNGPLLQNRQFLIGDLSDLIPREQKLYSLSEYVLNPTKEVVKSDDLGISIIRFETENGNDTKEMDKGDSGNVSMDDISVENVEVSNLFIAKQLKKKLYLTQSFIQWKTCHGYETMFSCCRPIKRTIYIQPVDNFPDFIKEFEFKLDSYRHSFNFFTFMQAFAEIFFSGMTVRILPGFNLVSSKWNIKTRVHSKTGQKQYLVGDFFTKLSRVMPPDGYCIMGIIWTDLYPCEKLNFVLGEASNLHKAGIHCFGRFEPKTYELESHKDISEIEGKLIWRLIKVFSHELCHLFGLGHCEYFHCSMNESGSMAEAFSQPLFLCPVCLRKLQYACDFEILQRYKRFHTFMADLCSVYSTYEIRYSVIWLEKIIQFLESDNKMFASEDS